MAPTFAKETSGRRNSAVLGQIGLACISPKSVLSSFVLSMRSTSVLENYIVAGRVAGGTGSADAGVSRAAETGAACGPRGRDGEFDPGSGRTLAACLIHASRAGWGETSGQRRTGEEHVSDLAGGGGYRAERRGNPAYALAVTAAGESAGAHPQGGSRPIS